MKSDENDEFAQLFADLRKFKVSENPQHLSEDELELENVRLEAQCIRLQKVASTCQEKLMKLYNSASPFSRFINEHSGEDFGAALLEHEREIYGWVGAAETI